MMKKFFLALIMLFFLTPFHAQEVVVFKSYKSLRIVSHSQKNGWTYLKLKNGEMAVRSDSIISISRETTTAPAAANPPSRSQSAPRTPSAASRQTPTPRPPVTRVPTVKERHPPPPAKGRRGRIRGRFDQKHAPRPFKSGNSARPVRPPRKKS